MLDAILAMDKPVYKEEDRSRVIRQRHSGRRVPLYRGGKRRGCFKGRILSAEEAEQSKAKLIRLGCAGAYQV